MPPPNEVCVITVNGQQYRDWESVWVRQEFATGLFRTFRVSASEAGPDLRFANMQILPGDSVTVELAGQLAITGVVYETQRYMDANRHGLMIVGQSKPGTWSISSYYKQNGTGEYKGYTPSKILADTLSRFGIGLVDYSGSNSSSQSLPRFQVFPGETNWEIADRLGRVGGFVYSDDPMGNLVITDFATVGGGGLFQNAAAGALVEGVNIISGRVTVIDNSLVNFVNVLSPQQGSDSNFGAQANQQQTNVPMTSRGQNKVSSFVSEVPLSLSQLMRRAQMEINYRWSEHLRAEIIVYGWLNDMGDLWEVKQTATVTSPMLALNHALIVRAVTFTQDNAEGTRTLLELCNMQDMGPGGPIAPGQSGTPQSP